MEVWDQSLIVTSLFEGLPRPGHGFTAVVHPSHRATIDTPSTYSQPLKPDHLHPCFAGGIRTLPQVSKDRPAQRHTQSAQEQQGTRSAPASSLARDILNMPTLGAQNQVPPFQSCYQLCQKHMELKFGLSGCKAKLTVQEGRLAKSRT